MKRQLRSKKTGVLFGYDETMYNTGEYDLITMKPKTRKKRTAKPKASAKDTQLMDTVSETDNEQDNS